MHERRLSLRLLSYWERARATRTMPSEADIVPHALEDVWQDCFILRVLSSEKLEFEPTHRGNNLHADWPKMAHLNGSLANLLAKRGPVLEDGQIYDVDGTVMKYRQCLLPLGHNGEVTAILGGARFKLSDW